MCFLRKLFKMKISNGKTFCQHEWYETSRYYSGESDGGFYLKRMSLYCPECRMRWDVPEEIGERVLKEREIQREYDER